MNRFSIINEPSFSRECIARQYVFIFWWKSFFYFSFIDRDCDHQIDLILALCFC